MLPWEKFSRATFMPSIINSFKTSSEEEAGPMVQTILVLLSGKCIVSVILFHTLDITQYGTD
jgi:hypothetical protein